MQQRLKLAAIMLTLLNAALGQVTISGATVSGVTIGPPSNLIIGPVYTAYTGNSIVTPWPTIPDMGDRIKNNAVWHDPSYPSGTPPPVIRCTDSVTAPGSLVNHSFSAGYGGSGDAVQLFNADDTLVHVNISGGGNAIIPILSNGQCGSGFASGGAIVNFGDGSFDWTNRNIWHNYNGYAPQDYTFTNVTTGTFTGPVQVADMTLGLPLGSNAPAWQSGQSYTTGQYVSVTGSYPDWQANHTYNPGDIILPTMNNFWGCAFYMSQATAKISASSAPNFSTSPQGKCQTPSQTLLTDGTARWRNLQGVGVFTYQLTSVGGTSGLTFNLPTNPQLLSTVSDNGMTWTNMGVGMLPVWNSFGGISRDASRICAGFSNNGYAWNNNFTGMTADQDTGQWVTCYDKTANRYHLLNTILGNQSSTTCAGGTGYNCSGGTITMTFDGNPAGLAGCAFFVHNDKGSANGDYQLVSHLAEVAGNTCNNAVVWRPFAAYNATTAVQATAAKFSHGALGATHVQALFSSDTTLYGAHSGVAGTIYDLTSPGTTPPISLQNSPCAFPFTIGSGLPAPCDAAYWDQHLAWAYNPGDADTSPTCGTIYNLYSLSPIPFAPWMGEEVCVSTTPKWTDLAHPGAQTVWRFTHDMATGASTVFDAQFQISQMSGTGKKIAFTSDWGCTLGSTNGTDPIVCGAPWLPGFAYNLNDMVAPIGQTQGNGAIYDIFTVTTPGTSGTSFPGYATPALAWAHCTNTAGCTVTDSNGVVYTDVNGNPSNARADVFIVQLAP